MCTVTYLPINKDEFILTSNRDVSFTRVKALKPQKYIENGIEIYYPKDGKAGGTWIGSSSQNRVLCLLNGGFVNHKSKSHYKKSRGKIVLELLICEHLATALKNIDLNDIEPFTLVIVEWDKELKLMEFVWDSKNKFIKNLEQKPHIWSSSTLYSDEIKKMRIKWFHEWQKKNIFSDKHILKFHHQAGAGDKKNDVLMKRKNVGTVSITEIIKDNSGLKMKYESIVH